MKKFAVLVAFFLVILRGTFASPAGLSVDRPLKGKSYFEVSLSGSADLPDGKYPGWCADWARPIEENTSYQYRFYSSYNLNLPAGLVHRPEFLDEVNWIANQTLVGRSSGDNLGAYTSGDVQLAIWSLIDDTYDGSTVGPYSQARVDRIVAAALKMGSDFRPNCRQEVVLVLDAGTPQSVLVEIPIKQFKKCVVPEEG